MPSARHSMPIYYFGSRRGGHSLNYKFEKTQVINLYEKPEYIQLSGASSFFRFSALQNYKFEEGLRVSEDPLLINQMLLDNPNIGFLDGCAYYYRKHDDQTSLIGSSTNHKSYFTSRVDRYFLALIDYALKKKSEVPKFIQHVLMYDLQWIFEIRRINHLLDRQEITVLYAKLIKILSFIDSDVIIFQKSIPGILKTHILLLKKHDVKYLADKNSVGNDKCISKSWSSTESTLTSAKSKETTFSYWDTSPHSPTIRTFRLESMTSAQFLLKSSVSRKGTTSH